MAWMVPGLWKVARLRQQVQQTLLGRLHRRGAHAMEEHKNRLVYGLQFGRGDKGSDKIERVVHLDGPSAPALTVVTHVC